MVMSMGLFTMSWCCVASGYIVAVGLFKLVVRDACSRDWGMFQLLFATLGLAQLASTMSGFEEIMNRSMLDIYYGIIATLAVATVIRCYMKFVRGPAPKSVDMREKVVIVTGSNTGVGYETAKSLVQMGAHVIMACRSEEKAKSAIDQITRELEVVAGAIRNNTAPAVRGKMTFMKLDLASLESVRAFVAEFKASKLGLDSLVLNAGVMHSHRQLTSDGVEANLAVNYLGNFLLTTQLLPILKESKDARVVCVNSSLHRVPKAFRFEDPMFDKDYGMFKAYANSKLALLMFAEELQHRLDNEKSKVIVNSVNPGTVMTDISRNMSFFMRLGNSICKPVFHLFFKQPRAGAFTCVYATTTSKLRESGEPGASGVGGLYMMDSEPAPFNPAANDVKSRNTLWKLSEELVSAGSKKKR